MQGEIHTARFSPSGAILASGSFDRLICKYICTYVYVCIYVLFVHVNTCVCVSGSIYLHYHLALSLIQKASVFFNVACLL